jgi:ATP/maltotriose-dependent transcriptional regulator MalT
MHWEALAIARSLGDPSGEATMLASTAETIVRLGRLEEARQRLEQALAAKRQAGERLATAQILGTLAGLAYERGDLAGYERLAMEQLRIARETGSRPLTARALLHLSRYHLAVDDLDGAGRHVEEAVELTAAYGAQLDAVEARLEKGRLALAQREPREAARLAREAVDWYGRRGFELEEARAGSLLAEALLQQRRLADAQEAGRRPRLLMNRNEDPGVQIELRVATARVDAAAGEVGGALMQMRRAVEEADKGGFIAAGLEARLALGLFQLQGQDRVAGRETLDDVQRRARARGFRNLARRAEAALAGRPATGLALMPLGLSLRPAAVTGARAFL